MTPATPRNSSQRETNLTVKQQRQQQRAKKLEEYRRRQARAERNRRIGIVSAVVVAVGVLALVITSVVLTPQKPTYSAGGNAGPIKGVQEFSNSAGHVQTPVSYPQTPPAGGEHAPAWLNCGVYSQPVPNENAVHSMEHGAIWVTYDPSLPASERKTLTSKMPATYAILSPYDGLPTPIVLSGWNAQLQVKSADDPRISAFFEKYWKGGNAPEPGAPCTGAIDGPGKVS